MAVAAFKPLDFILAEMLGTKTPARCTACRNYKGDKFRVDSVCFKENLSKRPSSTD